MTTAVPSSRLGRLKSCWLAVALLGSATPAVGQDAPAAASPAACVAIVADAERLACYDHAFGREPAIAEEPAAPVVESAKSLLDSRWDCLPKSKLGTFGLRGYQPVYVLPWVGASEVNQRPGSPSPEHTVDRTEGLQASELKGQISAKTKLWQGVVGTTGDLWLGFTQSSRWQFYNSARSRPFRETNYEPELLLVFPTNYRLFGWDAHLLALGLNHQSNGRDNPRSRSWNRVTGSVGIERPGWTITFRPWWRIPEATGADDNPDIEDFIGRGDLLVVRHVRHHEITALLRHSLRTGERSRGAVQLDWAFPLRGSLRGHVQIFHGYGESLIDYNFETTRVGLGISLLEWY